MNYGELKEQIRDMGFSDDAEIEEFGELIPNSINRAIEEINLNVAPIIGIYEIEQDGTDTGLFFYDIESLTQDDDGNITFLDFADTPVMVGTDVYQKFNDFEIENENTIVMDGALEGTFRVFYKKKHTPVTVETSDTTKIELPLKAQHMLPYLAAYYIWLEDEQTKAVYYYNRYEELLQEYQTEKEKPRARIVSGGI